MPLLKEISSLFKEPRIHLDMRTISAMAHAHMKDLLHSLEAAEALTEATQCREALDF